MERKRKDANHDNVEELARKDLLLSWKYRHIIDEALTIQEKCEPGKESIEKISRVMDEANKLIGEVKTVEKAVLDAKVINISSQVLKQNAEAFDTNLLSYKPQVFSERILCHLHEGRQRKLDWERLSSVAKRCFNRRTPSYVFMYGALQIDKVLPEKKPRKVRAKQVEGNTKVPENVNVVSESSDELSVTVNHILKTLNKEWRCNEGRPICYFKLIIDPESFGRTVENIFHVAFLVKDGLVDYRMGENGLPVIVPVSKQLADRRKSGAADLEKQQMIMSISMDQWQELKEAFRIDTPMIKPYTKPAQNEKAKKRHAT